MMFLVIMDPAQVGEDLADDQLMEQLPESSGIVMVSFS